MSANHRTMSSIERLWVLAGRSHPPFANQLVLEGTPGADLSEVRLSEAMEQVIARHPGARLRASGVLGWSKWVADGHPPPVRTVDGARWSGRDPAHAPFLRQPLPTEAGPTTELLRVEGAPLRLVLRTHHGVMDGGGTTLLALDLFRALRGEPVEGAALDPTTDLALARARDPGPVPKRAARFGAPTGPGAGDLQQTTWLRRTYTGPTRRLLPRVALAIHAVSRQWTPHPLSLVVPVDLRRQQPSLRSTANLTGAVDLDLDVDLDTPEGAAQDPVERLAALLAERASGPDAVNGIVAGWPLRWMPLWLLTWLGQTAFRKENKAGRYPNSGAISNLGRMDLGALSCPGFTPERAFWIPPGSPGQRLFLTLTGGPAGVELCCTMAEGYASGGRLAALLDGVIDALG